jgi:hypothetical protein
MLVLRLFLLDVLGIISVRCTYLGIVTAHLLIILLSQGDPTIFPQKSACIVC